MKRRTQPAACLVLLLGALVAPIWGQNQPLVANPPAAAAPAPVPAADGSIVSGKIGEKLDDYLSRMEAFGFNGAVLYAKKGTIYLQKAYGYASTTERRRNTLDTLFDVASVSKQFTAAGILKLQMEGKLATDDPITKFFPKLGDEKSRIMLFHLLNHTSGLPNNIPAGPETKDRDELIELVRDAEMPAAPGEQFVYNNIGYCLLAAVIEVASGQKFETYMREHVFAPAGLKNVSFLGERPKVPTACAHRGDWEMWAAEEGWFSWGWRGCAAMLCSVPDLYQWELALRDDRVLNKESRLELFNRVRPDYAYGWMVRTDEDKRVVYYHDGDTRGFQSHIEHCPKDNAVLIVLCNDEVKGRPVTSGVRALIGNYGLELPPKPVALTPEQLKKLAIEYVLDEGGATFRLEVDDGALVLKNYGLVAVSTRLKGRTEADVKRAPRYDKRAVEALQAWHAGDMEPLQDLLPESQQAMAQRMAGAWGSLMEAAGGLKRVDVLGTVPRTLEEVHTFFALVGTTRTDVLKLIWHDGELNNWDPTYPGIMRFVPVAENEFISYEITPEITPRDRAMKFVLDDQGNPEQIAIMIDFVRLFATPKKSP